MSSAHVKTALRAAFLLVATVSGAAAQNEEPIGGYVIDLRGSTANLGGNEDLAAMRGLRPDQLPARGLGVDLGAHVYFFRWRAVTFGLGASVQSAAAQLEPAAPMPGEPAPPAPMPRVPAPGEPTPDETAPGAVVTSRFTALSPQISFNFGHRNGWSYLGGGLGASRLNVYPQQPTTPPQRRARTLNYGGGARWFLTPNVALSLDLRFFAISPLPQMGDQPGSPRQTLMATNVGVSVR